MTQNNSTKEIADAFNRAMNELSEKSIKDGYFPHYFMQMVGQYGGVETAKRLLAKNDTQSGLTRLWELNLLDQSMEAHVLQPRFQCLFTEEELAEARKRLTDRGFIVQ